MIEELGYNIYENTMRYPHVFYETEAILKNPSYLQRKKLQLGAFMKVITKPCLLNWFQIKRR